MSFVRTTARVIVGAVTVPVGITLGVASGAIAGAVVGGVVGGAYGWQAAGAIVCDKSVQRKSMAQHQAEVLYSFMPKEMRKEAADAVVREIMKTKVAEQVPPVVVNVSPAAQPAPAV